MQPEGGGRGGLGGCEGKPLIRMIGGSQEVHTAAPESSLPPGETFLKCSKVDTKLDSQSSHWMSCFDFLQFFSQDHKVIK